MWKKLLFIAFLGMSPALAGPPAAPDLAAGELAQLQKGEVVIRPPDANGLAVGIVDIDASAEQVWSVILDFPARVESVGVLQSIDVYAPESDSRGLGATFHLRVLGSDIRYHLRYTIDRAAGYCTFRLDPERQHDIVAADGSYQVIPLDGGRHRVVYTSRTETGRFVPGFVKKMLSNESLRSQLQEMKRRAPTK